VRDERYKLIEYVVDGARHTQLFDLEKDPFETDNLADAAEHQNTLKRLRALLQAERIRLNDGNVPYPFSREQGENFWASYREAEVPPKKPCFSW